MRAAPPAIRAVRAQSRSPALERMLMALGTRRSESHTGGRAQRRKYTRRRGLMSPIASPESVSIAFLIMSGVIAAW